MATSTDSAFPLATETPYEPDAAAGSANAGSSSGDDGTLAGASGSSTGNYELSHGGLIAIIVVVCVVAIFGVASAVLFFLAKKNEWKVRETIRRSARRVVTALTPRRSEFPKSVKESGSRNGRIKLDDVPPTPRIKTEHLDLEKGLEKPNKKRSNFSRK